MPETQHSTDEAIRTIDSLLNGGSAVGVEQAAIELPATAQENSASMPQLDFSTYSSQVFWLLATFLLLYLLISRSALPRIHEIVEKRRHRIESDLDRAERLSEEATQAQAAYEQMQRQAQENATALIDEASTEIAERQESEFSAVDADIIAMLGASDKDIADRRQALTKELTPMACELAESVIRSLTGKAPKTADIDAAIKS